MSEKSDEISDISEQDVSEGTVANPVFVSQVDPSLSQIEELKPVHTTNKTMNPRELSNISPELPCTSSPTQKRPKKISWFPTRFDPNSYNYSFINESPKSSSQKTPNMIAKNIKSIKLIPHSFSQTQCFKPKPRPKQSPIDVEERFYSYQRKIDEKLRKKREERDSNIEECTFHPKIAKNARSRSFEEFYSDALKYDEHRKRKLKEMRNEKSEENFSFKPKISEKSSLLMQTKNNGNCFDRLCTVQKNQSQTKSFYLMSGTSRDFLNYLSFVPKVNKSEKDLKREMPTNILFSETTRKRKKVNYEIKPTTIATSQNSIKILVKGFLKEFNKQSKSIDVDRTGKLNYTRYIDILRALKFHREKPSNEEIVMVLEIWDILSASSGYTSVEDLKVMLMGVMGFYQPWMESHSQFTLDTATASEIHEKYSMLFKTRSSLNSKFKSPDHKATNSPTEKTKGFYDKMTERVNCRKKKQKEFKEKIDLNSSIPVITANLVPLEYPTFSTTTNDPECQAKSDLLTVPSAVESLNSRSFDSKVSTSPRKAPPRGIKRFNSLQPGYFEPLYVTIAHEELVNFKMEERIMCEFVRKQSAQEFYP